MEGNTSDNHRRQSSKPTVVDELYAASAAASTTDPTLWNAFGENFQRVQTLLDRNKNLINQVNENHRSKLPENMKKNVALINEINDNISKATSIYSNISAKFSGSQIDGSKRRRDDPESS